VNDLSHHIYEVDEMVVGNSLEAVSYSYLNEKPLLLNSRKKPYFFEFFEKGSSLEKYMVDSVEYELSTPNGIRKVGASKLEVWEKLVFYLSVAGLTSTADKAFSIRIEDDNLIKVTTHDSRVIRFKFNNLRIFDTENIAGFDSFKNSEKYKVVDWVHVRSGMKHEHDYLETDDDFVKEVYFYPSYRMGSGENDDRKDLVAVSYLTKKQLDDFEYSDTYVKFKVLNLMKEAGIKGPRNGRRHDDPNKHAYHSVKIEPSSREICVNEKMLHESENSFVFDNRDERTIYQNCEPGKNYLYKINENLR